MKKLLISLSLSLIIAFSSVVGLYGCVDDGSFTVTFSPGKYTQATLADGFTQEHLVQRVKDAKELILPVFICDQAYHVGWDDIPENITKDTTLTAVWYEKEFVVKFEPGAIDATLVSGSEEIKTNTVTNITPPVYERKGYTMDPTWGGYNFDVINSNVTVTAKWIPNTYKIYLQEQDDSTLNFENQDLIKTDDNGKVYFEVKYGQPIGELPVPKKDGKTFGAWKLEQVATKVFSESLYLFDYDITLEALWVEESEYLIFYNGVEKTDNPISYSVGDSFTLNNPTKEGYDFIGWTYEGQTQPVMSVKINSTDIGNKEFTAHWQIKTYTIQLDGLSGAQISNKYLFVTYGDKVGEMPTPEREGFEFLYWTTQNGTVINSDTVWTIDDTSIVLTAKYTRIYTIKFVLKYTLNKVDVYSNFKPGTYEHLNLVKSETEENTYLMLGVKENDTIPTLPVAVPYTPHNDPTNSYVFLNWKHRHPNKKLVTINKGMLINEEKFPGTYESGEIILLAACRTDWIDGWY